VHNDTGKKGRGKRYPARPGRQRAVRPSRVSGSAGGLPVKPPPCSCCAERRTRSSHQLRRGRDRSPGDPGRRHNTELVQLRDAPVWQVRPPRHAALLCCQAWPHRKDATAHRERSLRSRPIVKADVNRWTSAGLLPLDQLIGDVIDIASANDAESGGQRRAVTRIRRRGGMQGLRGGFGWAVCTGLYRSLGLLVGRNAVCSRSYVGDCRWFAHPPASVGL
jgi:hypothetical protein